MKKLLMLMAAFGVMFYLSSCGDDDDGTPSFDEPGVTAAAASDIANGGTGSVSFTITLDSDLTTEASWTLTRTGDITFEGGEETLTGTTSGGTVEFPITAGTNAGAASVRLVVVDTEGGNGEATAVFNVLAADDNPVTLSGIPEEALISDGDDLVITGISLEAPDGLATFEVTVNGGTPIDLIAFSNDLTVGLTSLVEFDLTFTKANLGYSVSDDIEVVFTAVDNNNSRARFEHTLQVAPAVSNYVETATTDRGNPAREVSGLIEDEQTWDAANVYIITGRLIVGSTGTLNIPAGTVIKAEQGAGVNAKALLVASGGTLNAQGTAALPIIMTSILDGISAADVAGGNFVGTLAADVNSLWGGLIVLGDAPIAASQTQVAIEGIPTSVAEGLYGGTNDSHNAGTITYISVRHGGSNIGSGNEINGITLGGVGAATTIRNVEVVANQDDGIEWFGGDVDITNALVWNAGDDALDTDQDWVGTCENFIVVTPDGSAFELDGPEPADAAASGVHTFNNGLVYAGGDIDHLVDFDGNTNAQLTNIYFYGWDEDYGFIQDEDPEEDGDQNFNPIKSFGGDGSGTSANWEYTLATGANAADAAEIFAGVPTAALTEVVTNGNTVGPTDDTGFEWTFASQSGALGTIGL